MLKKIRTFKLKKNEAKQKVLLRSAIPPLIPPKIVLKFFSKVHAVQRYEEVFTS